MENHTHPDKEAPVKVKPDVDTEVFASIDPRTLEEGCVYVHCRCANRGDDLLVRIWKTTFLIDHHSSAKPQLLACRKHNHCTTVAAGAERCYP